MFARRMAAYLLLAAAVGCGNAPEMADSGKDGWLKGGAGEQMETVARHLRGNDIAMWEVGYRFGELYWAGAEENWPLAAYQLTKIRLAMDLANQRRPKRAASYAAFFDEGLPEINEAVAAKDKAAFDTGFDVLTAACNSCHVAENLEFFVVRKPDYRPAPLGRSIDNGQ